MPKTLYDRWAKANVGRRRVSFGAGAARRGRDNGGGGDQGGGTDRIAVWEGEQIVTAAPTRTGVENPQTGDDVRALTQIHVP